ncbi:hypothetical protein HGM15179_004577 [Zosterops borbonicus]|uniref:Uncharacterized protein n=1 Tax=Zosterops borbonicus TaxID=364589 RepID=A0A8K1LQT2_9PASS|nr:hypothetical protein HGM15179_004577 [Zosterops borbonicus]
MEVTAQSSGLYLFTDICPVNKDSAEHNLVQKIMQPGEIHKDWEKGNVTPIFMNVKVEGPENCRLVITTPEKLVKQLILKMIFKLMKERVVGSNQTGFIKVECCLIDLIAF